MTTYLVTGAGGFIGRALAARLRNVPQARVLELRRSDGPAQWRIALEDLSPSFWTDRSVEAIDAVFHLGGYTPKNWAQANVERPIVTSTIAGTLALLESLPSVPRHLVFASSVDVYKHEPGATIDESSAIAPTTLHGASKVFAEQLIRAYASRAGCHYSILRLGHIFGPGEERYEKVIPNLIRAMLQGTQPQLSGDGSTERDFLYVDDAAAAIVAAGLRDRSADPVNVVRGESISILGVAKRLAEIIGYRGSFGYSGNNGDSLRFDNGVMKQTLRIEEFLPIGEGLAREVASFRGHDCAAPEPPK